HGAKGFAEAPSLATAPAILNAIYDAVGVRITSLPADKQRVKAALHATHSQTAENVTAQACHPEGALCATEGSQGQSEEILRRWKNTSGSHRPDVLRENDNLAE
ncbi:MAG: hypothetical protein KJ606_01355, partial [Chloroflexi bacterium]|nr:hypothetical protein [Chloroflexota bacterium]